MSDNIYNLPPRQITNQSIRELINSYNNNQRIYNLNIHDYNRNITSLISLLETNSNSNRPITPRSRTVRSPNFRNSNLYENTTRNIFSDEFYANILLGISSQIQTPRRGLTEIEFETYTQTIERTTDMSSNICQITHEEFEENERVCQILHCGHYFKRDAIFRWLHTNSTCPLCRHNILSSDTIRNTNIHENNETIDENNETNDENNEFYEEPEILNPTNNNIIEFIRNSISSDVSLNIDPSFNLHYTFELPMTYYPPNNNV